jgi:hypothetical protein
MRRLVILFVTAACGTSESSGLLTKGISAEISATTTGNGTTSVSVELFEGNPDQLIFVDLESGDQLVATTADDSQALAKSQLLTIIAYDAELAAGDEGDQITVDFQRDVDDGAPTSVATLPAPFALDPSPASSSRGVAMTLTYAPAGTPDDMSWTASGDCIQTATGPLSDDNGSLTIPSGALIAASGQSSASCTVMLTVTRAGGGTLDGHFKGGQIVGQQARTIMFTSAP